MEACFSASYTFGQMQNYPNGAYRGRHRTKPRLIGGWNCSPEEYKALGYTIGLPPGFISRENTLVRELSDELNASFQDQLTGRSTILPPDFVRRTYSSIQITRLRRVGDPYEVVWVLEDALARAFPCYRKGAILRTDYIPSHECIVVDFPHPDYVVMALSIQHSVEFMGRRLRIVPFVSLTPNIDKCTRITRVNLCNVVVYHTFSREELNNITDKYRFILRYTVTNYGFTVFQVESEDCVQYLIYCLKPKYQAHQLLFPGPTRHHQQEFIPKDSVTTLVKDSLTLDMLFDQTKSLIHIVKKDQIPEKGYSSLLIYNVVRAMYLRSNTEIACVVEEFRQYLAQIDPSTRVDVFRSVYRLSNEYVVLKVRFASSEKAAEAQRFLSGKLYMGRIVITQLCK